MSGDDIKMLESVHCPVCGGHGYLEECASCDPFGKEPRWWAVEFRHRHGCWVPTGSPPPARSMGAAVNKAKRRPRKWKDTD